MRRREMLRLGLMVAGAGIGVPITWASARSDRRSGVRRPSAGDARLADLGARFAMDDPSTAAVLVSEVASRCGYVPGDVEPDSQRVRAALLGARTRRRDLDRGDVLAVDGWMLTRSEVACCVYLDALRGRSAGGGPRAELR